MAGHSRFGGSVWHRVLPCPASVQREAPFPNEETPFAAEGTLLHEAAAAVLTRDPNEAEILRKLNPEQRDVVSAYVNVVRDESDLAALLVEQRFSIRALHPEFTGTADAVVLDRGKLKVIDLKCGAGVSVQADYGGFINPQLGFYMLGALAALGWEIQPGQITPPPLNRVVDFEAIIVQPRMGGVKRRKVALLELEDLATDFIEAATEAGEPNPTAKAGLHCKFCRARGVCPDLRKHVMDLAKQEFGKVKADTLPDPRDMDAIELAEALRTAELMELWIKGVRDHAKNVLAKGVAIAGWKVVQRLGNRKWVEGYEPGMLARQMSGVAVTDLYEEPKPLSPAQTERVLKEHGLDPGYIGQFVQRSPAGTALVKESDPRSAVSTATPADDFLED
jgi:hypothetical protein